MSRLMRVVATVASTLLVLVVAPGGPARAGLPAGDTADSDPAATWGWEQVFFEGFDGPAGTPPEQWHTITGWNGALQNGLGQLDVGRLAQIRTNPGWTLPAGTQVRVTATLTMPDTGANYAAFWVQHPDGLDPREIDVIESYGPLKPTGAQVGSHICYDDVPDSAAGKCAAAGMSAELMPVSSLLPVGLEPWSASWQYSADFTIGGDSVLFSASDVDGNVPYQVSSTPDLRRVPGNVAPIHLRLSNKDVLPEHAVAGGTRSSMLVDSVSVEVKYP